MLILFHLLFPKAVSKIGFRLSAVKLFPKVPALPHAHAPSAVFGKFAIEVLSFAEMIVILYPSFTRPAAGSGSCK
jgi:hypothetical protein